MNCVVEMSCLHNPETTTAQGGCLGPLRRIAVADRSDYLGLKGCLAESFLETISATEGSPFMARAMESLVAS